MGREDQEERGGLVARLGQEIVVNRDPAVTLQSKHAYVEMTPTVVLNGIRFVLVRLRHTVVGNVQGCVWTTQIVPIQRRRPAIHLPTNALDLARVTLIVLPSLALSVTWITGNVSSVSRTRTALLPILSVILQTTPVLVVYQTKIVQTRRCPCALPLGAAVARMPRIVQMQCRSASLEFAKSALQIAIAQILMLRFVLAPNVSLILREIAVNLPVESRGASIKRSRAVYAKKITSVAVALGIRSASAR